MSDDPAVKAAMNAHYRGAGIPTLELLTAIKLAAAYEAEANPYCDNGASLQVREWLRGRAVALRGDAS